MKIIRKLKLPALTSVLLVVPIGVVSCVPVPWDGPYGWFTFGWAPFIGFPLGLVGIGLYFLPTIFAAVRRSRSLLGIVLLNIFAGWTFIGWIIALVWSLTGATQKA